jgi:hypothetical protein
MSTYAQIEDGKIVNVILADAAFIALLPPSEIWEEVLGEGAIGWDYADGVFTAPPEPPAVTTYARYTYIGFLEKISDVGGSRALLRVKKADTDQAADVELFMEMIKHQDGVDFNSVISRARLASVVPSILTPQQETDILGEVVP